MNTPISTSTSPRVRSWQTLALGLLLPCLAGAAGAQDLSKPSVSVLAGTCVNCHGSNGKSTTAIPSLAGQPASRLLERMQAFKAGTAPDATVMTRLMKGYDAQQIQALAQWFSEVPQ